MIRKPINLTLHPDAAAMVRQTRNASEYVSRCVQRRWAAWRDARRETHDWPPRDLLAACDALAGASWLGPTLAHMVAAELRNGERSMGLCAKWQIDPDRWSRLAADLSYNPKLAHALVVIAEEYWAGNEAVAASIGTVDPMPA